LFWVIGTGTTLCIDILAAFTLRYTKHVLVRVYLKTSSILKCNETST